jgi:hypothetical protein
MTGFTRIATGYPDFGPCEICNEPADSVVTGKRRDGQIERHPRCPKHPFLIGIERDRQRLTEKYARGITDRTRGGR